MIRAWRRRWLPDERAPRINRAPSRLLAGGLPWLSVILASILPGQLFITSAPVLPPFGFLVLLAWKQLRPGLLPVWAGLPLGLIDDLYSGQPFGSAIMLWSLTLILYDIVETRVPWRNYAFEWVLGAAIIAAYIALALAIANGGMGDTRALVIVPQIVLSALIYPLVGRFVARLDQLRLLPIAEAE